MSLIPALRFSLGLVLLAAGQEDDSKTRAKSDGAAMLQKVIEEREHQQELERQYAFHERTITHNLYENGVVRSAKSETYLVTPAPGGEYRRLVQKNGQPLSTRDEAKEEEKFEAFLEEQLRESADSLTRKTDKKMKDRLERYGTRLQEALEVFSFENEPGETLEGVPVRVFSFAPKPGYRPEGRSRQILARLEGRIWIDPARNQIARLDLRFRESMKFLGGIFGRISEGSEASARAWLDGDVWLMDRLELLLDARLYFVKTYRQRITVDYSNYEKFTVSTEERTRPPQR